MTDLSTALSTIAVGAIIPAVTAVMTHPGTPARVKRLIPIGLAVVGGLVVMLVTGQLGTIPEWVTRAVLTVAALVGVSQGLYAAMPGTWKRLSEATSGEEAEQ